MEAVLSCTESCQLSRHLWPYVRVCRKGEGRGQMGWEGEGRQWNGNLRFHSPWPFFFIFSPDSEDSLLSAQCSLAAALTAASFSLTNPIILFLHLSNTLSFIGLIHVTMPFGTVPSATHRSCRSHLSMALLLVIYPLPWLGHCFLPGFLVLRRLHWFSMYNKGLLPSILWIPDCYLLKFQWKV